MKDIIYKGLFIDKMSEQALYYLEGISKLEKNIQNKHITFAFHPNTLFHDEILGKTYDISVIGYGNDGENSGFEILLPDSLLDYYAGNERVHITTSLSNTGKPQNTSYLKFEPIVPIQITGVLGYWVNKKGKVLTNTDLPS